MTATVCTAKAKSTGKRCRNPTVPGATVCRIHGGSAPQVRAAAARRILEALVGPALVEMRRLIDENTIATVPDSVRFAAVRDILDRCGYKPIQEFKGFLSIVMVEEEIARLEGKLEE